MRSFKKATLGLVLLSATLAGANALQAASQLGQEAIPANEDADAGTVRDMILKVLDKEHEAHPEAVMQRDAHPKAHGCVKASFTVAPGLPTTIAHGIFAMPGTYKSWIRYSNGSPGNNADSKPDGRGMAVKVMGVPGAKIVANDETSTQDFVMINHDTFFVRNAHDYISFNKNQALFLLTHALHEGIIALKTANAKITNPFQSQYWSMAPYRLGPDNLSQAMKYTAVPITCPNVAAPTPTPASSSHDFLREAMIHSMSQGDVCFKLQIQVQTNADTMPIEDPTISWDDAGVTAVDAAMIRISKAENDGKLGLQNAARTRFCENIVMSPWHALPEMRPLGGINRVRKVVYQAISQHRHEVNNVQYKEPKGDEQF